MSRLPSTTVSWAFLLTLNFFVSSSDVLGGAEVIQPIEASYNSAFSIEPRQAVLPAAKYKFTYRLGKRIAGDGLVASTYESRQWPETQNVTLDLTYPRVGVGSTISYVEIYVTQDSSLGSGVLSAGDVGQRLISIKIQAFKTAQFEHTTYVYGY